MKIVPDRRSKVEREIDSKIEGLLEEAKSGEEIEQVIDLVKGRHEMLAGKPRIKPDTWLIVAGNLAGIVLILKHEQLNVISTKALGFILRGRV
jgi:hypothetical protein